MKLKAIYKQLVFMFFDALAIFASYVLTILLLSAISVNIYDPLLILWVAIIVFLKVLLFHFLGVYKTITRHLDYGLIVRLIAIVGITNLILATLAAFRVITNMYWVTFVFIGALESLLLVIYRIALNVVLLYNETVIKRHITGKRTLILGAGAAGEIVLKEMLYKRTITNFVVGFLDDDIEKKGRKIINKTVLGTIDELDFFINQYAIEEIVIAIGAISRKKELELLNIINNYPNIKVKRINILEDINNNNVLKIVDVNVEDLLDRSPVNLEIKDIYNFIKDEVVLVTGGGGSIGSELSRQIFKLNPKTLIIFDIYENNAYEIQTELERLKYKDKSIKTNIETLIGSVYNKQRLEEIFKEFNPTLVFHAAAYKHVPLMEESAREAIRTNVVGTKNLTELANQYRVKKVVLVSSDKAVRATNVMGATKRYAEIIISNANEIGPTNFSAVRFGNVLGSNGSVIPLFKKQILDGGPVTVTHKDIERYFMTIPEAVGLILQSAVYADGGEIFVLDMGSPVKIVDLAEKMIRLSGFIPYEDIDIEFTGLRPGEKLFEELLIDKDNNTLLETKNKRIFIESNVNKIFNEKLYLNLVSKYQDVSNYEVKLLLSEVVKSYQVNGDQNGK